MERGAWLKWRHDGVGGSDAASIHNLSKYKTYQQLLAEKSQLEPVDTPSNFIQMKGNDLEPKLRAFFSMHYFGERGVEDPFNAELVEHPKKRHMRSSLDGLSVCRRVFIECKLVGKKVLALGAVPVGYFCQIQHNIYVSGCDEAYCVMGDGFNMKIIPVPRDDSFIEIHKRKCKEFWALVEANRKLLQNPSGLAIIESEVQT